MKFSARVQTGPVAHPAPYTMGAGSFTGVKRSDYSPKHPPASSPQVKERVELHLYSSVHSFILFLYPCNFHLPFLHFSNNPSPLPANLLHKQSTLQTSTRNCHHHKSSSMLHTVSTYRVPEQGIRIRYGAHICQKFTALPHLSMTQGKMNGKQIPVVCRLPMRSNPRHICCA